MTLADIDLDYEEVTFPNGKSFSVRGISMLDVNKLIREHGPEIQVFFAKYAGADNGSPSTAVAEVGLSLLDSAPSLAAKIIAHAADDPDQAEKVQKFPLGIQMDALEKIAKLTFEAGGGAKKFGEAVVRLLQNTTNLMGEFNQSTIGSLVSDGK
jgi:hypothetical protein